MRRRLRNAGRPGIAGLALSAADCALWDLKARRHGLPLARLLGTARGGGARLRQRRLHHLRRGRSSTQQLAGWVHEQGIPRVKIKIGESCGTEVARDLARMTAARRTIGDDAELYVDANGAYQRKQAIRVAYAAADLDVRWYEEPVSSDDLPGLGLVRDRVAPDVTAGEYGYDLVYFHRMAPYVDCLQIDVTRCGGISEFLRAAAVAAAAGHPGVRALRTAPAPAGRRRHAQPSTPGMVPRPRPHRVDALRRRAAGHGRHGAGADRSAGQRTGVPHRPGPAVPGGLR